MYDTGLDRGERYRCSHSEKFFRARTITAPDRFERHLGFAKTHREWWTCGDCGFSENRCLLDGLEAGIRAIESNYFEIDFPGVSVEQRYAELTRISPGESDNYFRVARVSNFLKSRFGTRSLRLGDIGSGVGFFPSKLRETLEASHTTLDVYEPDTACHKFLSDLDLFNNVFTFFPDSQMTGTYDFLSLNKVIEHLSDPRQLLVAVRNALSPQGVLYVEVPSSRSILTVPEDDNSIGALHRHLFSQTSMSNLMLSLGFETLEDDEIVEVSGKISVWGFFAANTVALTETPER